MTFRRNISHPFSVSMETICSSEILLAFNGLHSVIFQKIIHAHRCENLKFSLFLFFFNFGTEYFLSGLVSLFYHERKFINEKHSNKWKEFQIVDGPVLHQRHHRKKQFHKFSQKISVDTICLFQHLFFANSLKYSLEEM